MDEFLKVFEDLEDSIAAAGEDASGLEGDDRAGAASALAAIAEVLEAAEEARRKYEEDEKALQEDDASSVSEEARQDSVPTISEEARAKAKEAVADLREALREHADKAKAEAPSDTPEAKRTTEVREATADAKGLATSAATTPAEKEPSGKRAAAVERTEGGGTHIRGPVTFEGPTVIRNGRVSKGRTIGEALTKASGERTTNNPPARATPNESGKRPGWLERRRQKKEARKAKRQK